MNRQREVKPWFASKGVIGGLVAALAGLIGLSADDTAHLVELLSNATAIVGGLLAVYGRIRAQQRLI